MSSARGSARGGGGGDVRGLRRGRREVVECFSPIGVAEVAVVREALVEGRTERVPKNAGDGRPLAVEWPKAGSMRGKEGIWPEVRRGRGGSPPVANDRLDVGGGDGGGRFSCPAGMAGWLDAQRDYGRRCPLGHLVKACRGCEVEAVVGEKAGVVFGPEGGSFRRASRKRPSSMVHRWRWGEIGADDLSPCLVACLFGGPLGPYGGYRTRASVGRRSRVGGRGSRRHGPMSGPAAFLAGSIIGRRKRSGVIRRL